MLLRVRVGTGPVELVRVVRKWKPPVVGQAFEIRRRDTAGNWSNEKVPVRCDSIGYLGAGEHTYYLSMN